MLLACAVLLLYFAPASAQNGAPGELWSVRSGRQITGLVRPVGFGPALDGATVVTLRGLYRVGADGSVATVQETGDETRIIISPDGGHFGVMTLNPQVFSNTLEARKVARFELRSIAGELTWGADDPPDHAFAVSADAGIVVGLEYKGTVNEVTGIDYRFYQHGTAVSTLEADFRFWGRAFSADGQYLLLNDKDSGLSVYDALGALQAAIPGSFRYFSASDACRIIAATREREPVVDVFRNSVERLATIPLSAAAHNVVVSANGEFMAIHNQFAVQLYAVGDGGVSRLWRRALGGADRSLNSVHVSDTGRVSVGVQVDGGHGLPAKRRWTDGATYLLGASEGTILFERAVRYSNSNAWMPTVRLSRDGGRLLIQTREEVTLVEVD